MHAYNEDIMRQEELNDFDALEASLREVKPEARTTGKTTVQMMALEAKRIEAARASARERVVG